MHARTRAERTAWRVLRQQVLERDGNQCVWCGTSDNLTLHHVIPLRHGGKTTAENLTTFCRSCHTEIERLEAQQEDEILDLSAYDFVKHYTKAQHKLGHWVSTEDRRIIHGLLQGR